MSKLSVLRKLGVVARIANQQVGRNRTLSAVRSGVFTTLRSFGHAMHVLWLEVTGTLFLSIALFGGVALVREYLKYSSGHTNPNRLGITLAFTLTFAWFGLSSFLRVRRKSQRP